MALASLQEIPKSALEFAEWSFAHAAHHRDIIRVIYRDYGGARLDEYVLDPFDPRGSTEVWAENHAAMHNAMDAVLGIAGYNLSEVDWTDERSLGDWLSAHFNEHYQAGQILGLG